MDESAALDLVTEIVGAAGDDAAVIDGHVITTDMLHERTDFPEGTTRYTAGWRAVGASLSDVAAMGARAVAAVAVYAAPTFEAAELESFLAGATAVCNRVGADYVGGDLDTHQEFTVASTAIGAAEDPVYRSGANPGDCIYVTGTFGRTAAALAYFERGEYDRANELFRFDPRVAAGRAIAPVATGMIDSSDGLARSLHQLAAASDVGVAIEPSAIPVHPAVDEVTSDESDRLDRALYVGEDFELVFTGPPTAIEERAADLTVPITAVGTVTEEGVRIDSEPLPDRGYAHGEN